MEIKYDTPIEVNQNQYRAAVQLLSGAIAHRTEGNKFYVKLWSMKPHYVNILEKILTPVENKPDGSTL
jgi:hypothetical protein